MKKILSLTIFISCCFSITAQDNTASKQTLHITSPGNSHSITVNYEKADSTGRLVYSVDFLGKNLIEKSQMGLDLDNRTWEMALALGQRKLKQPKCWMDNFEVDSVTYNPTVDRTWHPLYGERSTVKDCYNSATMYLSKRDGSNYRLNIEVRAYDEGVAFRYFFPEHPAAVFHKVVADLTEYSFPEGVMAWTEDWAQAPFEHKPIKDITRPVERALTLDYPDGKTWCAIADADVDDWCLTKFVADPKRPNTLTSVMYSPVDIVTYYATPWKIIMGAETPGQLLEHNDIIQNLNPPCEIEDTSWIKPGKIMRETTLTMEGAYKTIDFCEAHNIPYMLFDWKWYEPCTSHDGDATKVIDRLDMKKVVEYGREHGVGIWLYVNQHARMKQQRELFPLLREWGIVGVKSGFVEYASHRWATWLHDMVRYAAENHLMMNIHDEFRPSGFSRTYPNLLTQEGIHGNEEWPSATHNVTLPFTRMINGAADYTICYFDSRLKYTTHAHQLAASIVFYSPLETLFWYDTPSRYHGEPEVEWFDNLQTVFDDSRVLSGYPGRNVTIARRKGNEWFVGAMTGDTPYNEEINLEFLNPGETYLANIYTDDATVETATKVRCTYLTVNNGQTIKFNIPATGGVAIRFVPISKSEAKKYNKYNGKTL
jgi:alpha-glucosidase